MGNVVRFHTGGRKMFENIDKLRDKLYKLILKEDSLCKGEILKVSQELDKQISLYYINKTNENELASGY